MPNPTHCKQISPMEEAFAERVFEKAYGGHLRAVSQPGRFWDAMDLRNSVAKRLVEKAGPDAQSRFYETAEEFAWERIPLRTTHATFVELFDLADDQTLRAHFVDFLDTPLTTPEEETVARAALCRILGLPFTVSEKPNTAEITVQFNFVFEQVQVRLKDHPEKLAEFLIKFLAMGAQENAGDTIKKLIVIAASDSQLVEGLEKLREEMDRKFE
ncbi:hypothetical protein AK830_g6005 [Neonectria ditissima]|uniref:Uncharacterized protein n=1 Tax=Neonectria ditissima TaxID=78410 RepID=A0A0P7BKG5_9HYPO|nr:hypothetical protein AK830_g6005 [Neonectria ditissima]